MATASFTSPFNYFLQGGSMAAKGVSMRCPKLLPSHRNNDNHTRSDPASVPIDNCDLVPTILPNGEGCQHGAPAAAMMLSLRWSKRPTAYIIILDKKHPLSGSQKMSRFDAVTP